jgi:hypothetical protein
MKMDAPMVVSRQAPSSLQSSLFQDADADTPTNSSQRSSVRTQGDTASPNSTTPLSFTGWAINSSHTTRRRIHGSGSSLVARTWLRNATVTFNATTAQRSLEARGISHTPLQYDWRLAERHYGRSRPSNKTVNASVSVSRSIAGRLATSLATGTSSLR